MNNDKLRELRGLKQAEADREKELEDKIRSLMIEQLQLNKGMPLLKPLNEEWEQYRKGEG